MNRYAIFRFVCVVLLWIFLCILLVTSRKIDFMVIFTIIASGIIIFVPLYKRYKKAKSNKED